MNKRTVGRPLCREGGSAVGLGLRPCLVPMQPRDRHAEGGGRDPPVLPHGGRCAGGADCEGGAAGLGEQQGADTEDH